MKKSKHEKALDLMARWYSRAHNDVGSCVMCPRRYSMGNACRSLTGLSCAAAIKAHFLKRAK